MKLKMPLLRPWHMSQTTTHCNRGDENAASNWLKILPPRLDEVRTCLALNIELQQSCRGNHLAVVEALQKRGDHRTTNRVGDVARQALRASDFEFN